MERMIENRRLRLLRLVAGLLVAVGFLSVGPVSRGLSVWACGYVASVLSRAELAAQFLVIAYARHVSSRRGSAVNPAVFSEALAQAQPSAEDSISLAECRARLRALRAVLIHLPRHAMRLLSQTKSAKCSADVACVLAPRGDQNVSVGTRDWRLDGQRIERPPDKYVTVPDVISPPSGFRSGGEGGWVGC